MRSPSPRRAAASHILEAARVKREMRKVKVRMASNFARALTGNVVHQALLERGYQAGFESGAQMAQYLIQEQELRNEDEKES